MELSAGEGLLARRNATPAKFLVDSAEETLVTQTHKADGEILTRQIDFGAIGQPLPTRVHAETELLGLGMGDKAQQGGVGHDDGSQGEVVHSDGGDDKTAAVGREDRSATTERVGRGTRGCGHNEAVASVVSNKIVAYIEVGTQQRGIVETVETHFVEGKGGETATSIAGFDVEQCARFERVAAGHEVGDQTVDIVAPGGGEETKMSEVDT